MMREPGKGEFRVATDSIWLTLLSVLMCLAGVLLLPRVLNCRADINDLSVRAEGILKLSHDVAKVESLVVPRKPTHRIIHITDSHALSRANFSYLANMICDNLLSEEEFHDWNQAHADDVEVFQASQIRLLTWLTDYHGLRAVFHEGASDKTLPEVTGRIKGLRALALVRGKLNTEREELPGRIREEEAASHDSLALRKRLAQLESVREYVLRCGAIGQVLVERPFVQVLAAEDAKAYEDARSRSKRRGGSLYGPHYDRREAAIVRNLLSHGPCAVIVLGAAHDLSDEVRRQSHGRCEYIRVTTTNYPQPFKNGIPARVLRIQDARRAASRLDEMIKRTGPNGITLGY